VISVSSVAVGYIIDPANISRFVGCFFIPDNFNNMRASWAKFGEARAAVSVLDQKQQ
jgi:hypothetical protein